ncbi:hypothetical protein TrST_g9516 [Triparma strigata]|uniref:Pyrrolo-quinoline quinone repeat domain-containing protein n=1 Tax=Triparma strigata TaxID=1606541 RepID=A0A9W7ATG4_9STRA|nr:hypothetical protein TrST_g9516 [Triparma strigata]
MRGLLSTAFFIASSVASSPFPAPELLSKVTVGCHHWGKDCLVPGFAGTDSSPSLIGENLDRVAIGSYDGSIHILSSQDGDQLALLEGGGEDSPSYDPQTSSITVWGGLKGSTIINYNSDSLEENWRTDVPISNVATSGSGFGYIYAGTAEGASSTFYSLDSKTGATKWSYSASSEMWGTLGPLITPAMVCVGVGGDANFLLNKDSKLVCLDHNGTTLHETETGGRQIQSRPSAGKSVIYVGDYDSCLYAVDKEVGGVIAKYCLGRFGGYNSVIEGTSVVVTDGDGQEHVIFDSWDGNIYSLSLSLDEANFKVDWKANLGDSKFGGGGAASTPFVSKNEVLFVGGPTGVWSLKVETGEVIWFYETGEQCGSSPTVWDGKVGIGCEDGYFYILTTEAC